MKRQWVRDLAQGQRVDDVFTLTSKEFRTSRNGDPYLALEVGDRTGRIRGILFRPSATAMAVSAGSVVRVSGVVASYRGAHQLAVDGLAQAGSFDPGDFLPRGTQDADEVARRFRTLVTSVADAGLSGLLRAVFGDRAFMRRFAECPGSQSHHHAYLGGLIEHTVAVASLCSAAARLYASVDRDLLVTAALLHDVGKTDELAWSASIEFTDDGRLLGHIVLGAQRVRETIASGAAAVTPDTAARLLHAIISHHGELEWGSPKRPSTLEALLLHHADNLDAKAAGLAELLGAATAADERWTDAYNLFRRPLYAPAPVEDDRPSAPCEDDQYRAIPA